MKEIAKSIDKDIKIDEYNVAQFHKPEDLTSVFRKLTNGAAKVSNDLPPVVFFDEFDSALGNEELG